MLHHWAISVPIILISTICLCPTRLHSSQSLEQYLKQPETTVYLNKSGDFFYHDEYSTCHRFKCFEALQCDIKSNKQVTFYVYPPLKIFDDVGTTIYDTKSMMTSEFWQLLYTILNSSRYTLDPSEACVFIPSIDLTWLELTESKSVHSIYNALPYWHFSDGQPGSNHLIVSLDPNLTPRNILPSIDRAILASSRFDTWSMRQNFDVSIPMIFDTYPEIAHLSPTKWKIIFTQFGPISTMVRHSIDKLKEKYGEDMLVLSSDCDTKGKSSIVSECIGMNSRESSAKSDECRCTLDGQRHYRFPDVLRRGKFCLIVHIGENALLSDLGQYILVFAIKHGCVPILSSNLIPFLDSIIEWSKFSITLTNEYNMDGLVPVISSIEATNYELMRDIAAVIWSRHFQRLEQITVDLMNHFDSWVYMRDLPKP